MAASPPTPMDELEPRMIVNPSLTAEELLEELAGRIQQLYGSLDALAVRANAEGYELIYDALWAMLEDVYQLQSLRNALEERLAPGESAVTPIDKAGTRH